MDRPNTSNCECSQRLKKGLILLSISLIYIVIILNYAVLESNTATFALVGDNNVVMSNGYKGQATIAMEAESHTIIDGSNYNAKLPMASTTKVLTAYIACISGKLDDIVTVPREAVGVEGSSIYLQEGEKITLRDLTYGLMLRSGNDSAVAISCFISGSVDKFAALMNEVAANIGAKNSNFMNPHGLHDDNHYTTAYDLAVITSTALDNEDFRQIVSTKMHVVKSAGQPDRYLANKNKMLSMYNGAIGVKTGYTKAAGRCLVSAAERNGLTIVSVVLNIPDMWEKSAQLLSTGFSSISKVEVCRQDTPIASIRLPRSNQVIELAIRDGYNYIARSSEPLDLEIEVELNQNLRYPLKNTENLGKFKLFNNKHLIFESNIYTMVDIPGKGVCPLDNKMIEDVIDINYGSISKIK